MLLIPQRLFESPQVKTLLRDENVCILEKNLSTSILDREGYISSHVVVILLEGTQEIKAYEDQKIKVKKGEVLFIPRGLYHITDLLTERGTFRSLLFYFDDATIQEFLTTVAISSFSKDKAPDYLKFDLLPAVEVFAESLIQIYQNKELQNKRSLRLKILELLHLLNDLKGEQQFVDFLFRLTLPKKRNIKRFIESNFDKPLKIEDYAYLTGRSVSTFRRDFKAYYDRTPQKWLKEKRLEKAIALLEEKELSVTQLAYEVGYENISYFIKEFKNHTGLSPKQYMLTRYRNNVKR